MNLDERRARIAEMSKAVFQYCLSRTRSYQESEDLSQEILLTLCESIGNLRDEKAFYAFVWRTADNILKGWYRSRRETLELDETLADHTWEHLEEQAQEHEQLLLITRELAHLNSSYRRVTVAYYIDGCPVKEIAARFSLTQSMVKYLLFQSRKRIREGIAMERNFGEYSYNPVHLEWRWMCPPVRDYGGLLPLSSIQQNLLMACCYSKQNEEQLSMLLGVPTAYLEDELRKLTEYELMTEQGGFYLTNAQVQTKRAAAERFRAKEAALRGAAARIQRFLAENEEALRAIGFYGCDMPVNSLKWMVLEVLLRMVYADDLDDALSANFPDGKACSFARVSLIEQEEAPKGDNYDPLWGFRSTEYGYILFHWVRFNSPVFHRLSDVQASVLTMLPARQPETEHEKMICTELIELDCAFREGNEIRPNYPCFTKEQKEAFLGLLSPVAQELLSGALGRTELTRQITEEHLPERFRPYVKDMIITQMFEEVSDITRLLAESDWLVPWSGMNPTNLIFLD
ncbi:MAG: sigma-70 family RNA polymerase sigma factor [Oscillospiraceae bacterium]|nr:sigma-70 family RNA polymerase sigma factor [Oscillospiraceae bacterium]